MRREGIQRHRPTARQSWRSLPPQDKKNAAEATRGSGSGKRWKGEDETEEGLVVVAVVEQIPVTMRDAVSVASVKHTV